MRGNITMDTELDIVFWRIVADKLDGSRVSILGETHESREQRHNGTQPMMGKTLSRNLAKNLMTSLTKSVELVIMTNCSSLSKLFPRNQRLEAERVRQRLANSSVA